MPETADERRRVLERALDVVAMIVEEKQLDPLRIVLNSDGEGKWEGHHRRRPPLLDAAPQLLHAPGRGDLLKIGLMRASQKGCLQQALR